MLTLVQPLRHQDTSPGAPHEVAPRRRPTGVEREQDVGDGSNTRTPRRPAPPRGTTTPKDHAHSLTKHHHLRSPGRAPQPKSSDWHRPPVGTSTQAAPLSKQQEQNLDHARWSDEGLSKQAEALETARAAAAAGASKSAPSLSAAAA